MRRSTRIKQGYDSDEYLQNYYCQHMYLYQSADRLATKAQFWANFLPMINVRIRSPPHLSGSSTADWWSNEDHLCRSILHRNRLRAAVMLGWWMLWLERNVSLQATLNVESL
ncbi:hypothetical protein BRADI_4g04423v3 [Brachypodium distachyon]|uniref:Uncharacterized protein n=1 Tax=Brachypodium distachyon TaxID=15368 RepID=A0A2K2CKE5_BRADI|nr:hypothetical protein BRADI_4g04423v3 [Brachypodium distachyon]